MVTSDYDEHHTTLQAAELQQGKLRSGLESIRRLVEGVRPTSPVPNVIGAVTVTSYTVNTCGLVCHKRLVSEQSFCVSQLAL